MSAFYNSPDFTLSLELLVEGNALNHSALRKNLAQGLTLTMKTFYIFLAFFLA